jgi:hypothetical protein
MRQTINAAKTSYHPNSISDGCPMQAKAAEGGFVSHAERIDAVKSETEAKVFLITLVRQLCSLTASQNRTATPDRCIYF